MVPVDTVPAAAKSKKSECTIYSHSKLQKQLVKKKKSLMNLHSLLKTTMNFKFPTLVAFKGQCYQHVHNKVK